MSIFLVIATDILITGSLKEVFSQCIELAMLSINTYIDFFSQIMTKRLIDSMRVALVYLFSLSYG